MIYGVCVPLVSTKNQTLLLVRTYVYSCSYLQSFMYRCYHVSSSASLSVKLWIVAEDTHGVFQSSFALEIVRQPFLILETRVERSEDQRELLLSSSHLFGESKLESVDDLPQGGIGVGEFAADEVLALALGLVVFQNTLKVGKELWDAGLAEVGGFFKSGVLLIFVLSVQVFQML